MNCSCFRIYNIDNTNIIVPILEIIISKSSWDFFPYFCLCVCVYYAIFFSLNIFNGISALFFYLISNVYIFLNYQYYIYCHPYKKLVYYNQHMSQYIGFIFCNLKKIILYVNI